jgi:uncharacterized membrane protein
MGNRNKNNLIILSLILAWASAGCAAMVLTRWILTQRLTHRYLLWNLFLAWTPYLIALFLVIARRIKRRGPRRILIGGIGLMWLVFYPNSPYIFTDLIHVINRSWLTTGAAEWLTPDSLLWYDVILTMMFSFTGHFIGLISLSIVHETVRQAWNRAVGWTVCMAAIFLSGMGIYIGRFVRINSWDLLKEPIETLSLIGASAFKPRALLFAAAFSFFIASTYLMLHIFRKADLSLPAPAPAGRSGDKGELP